MKKFYIAVRLIFQSANIFAFSVAAQIELATMDAENAERVSNGQALAYGSDAFNQLYKDHMNTVREIIDEK